MQPSKKGGFSTNQLCALALMCFCVFALLAVLGSSEPTAVVIDAAANSNGPLQITPGSSSKREIAAGATEVIEVSMNQGKLLRFSIDKGDLALSTALYDPGGANLIEHVSQEFEVVEISQPADAAGVYKIEVHSRETAQTPRSYELRVEPEANITAADRKDNDARQAMSHAEVLRSAWTEAALREAKEKYDQAATIWKSISSFSNASLATLRSGNVCFRLSRFPESLKRYQDAAGLAQKSNDAVAQGRALSQMGLLYSYMGQNGLAQEQLTNALALLKPGDSDRTPLAGIAYAEALSNSAEVNYAKGNFIKAATQFEEARKLFEGDRRGQAKTHLFKGYLAGTRGNPEKASAEISQALELYRAIGNKAGEGLALLGMGTSNSGKGVENTAIRLSREASEIFHSIGDRHSEAMALNAFGQAFENMNDFDLALDKYESALRLFESIGALDLASVSAYLIGRAHLKNDQRKKALVYFERCKTLSHAAGKSRFEALALDLIATLYESQNPTEALNQHRKAQEFYKSMGDRRGQSLALNNYGDFLLKLGQKEQALAAYTQALPLSEEMGDTGTLISTLYKLARAQYETGNYDVALSTIQRSVKIIEDLRKNVGSPDLRASYLSGVQSHYELWRDLLMQLERTRPGEGFAATAFEVSEQSRARSMLDLLGESQADLRKGASPELVEQERELKALIQSMAAYEMSLSPSEKSSGEAAEVVNQMAQLRADYQELQIQLREQSPGKLSLAQFEPATLDQIQKELRSAGDTMLLEYSLGEERSYLWAVTADSVRSYELPPRKVVVESTRELYDLITAREKFNLNTQREYQPEVEAADARYLEKAAGLSRMLLGPVADQLGSKRLVLVKEGVLQYLSFDALLHPSFPMNPSDPPYLIKTNEIVELPSMSTLVAMRGESDHPASPSHIVAVFADPVFSRIDDRVQGEDPSPVVAHAAMNQNSGNGTQGEAGRSQRGSSRPARLTYAAEEADAISAVAPSGTTMIAKGFDANRETAMSSLLGDYQIIHFATHAFLDSEHPELSGIALTMVDRNGVEKNGLIPLHDIYGLDLSAELTVLSACQTALGKDIKGEGLVGLTHSFMSAGSKSVVASLWKVDDRATSVLMSDFYESMLQQGIAPATALRSAKLKLMREKRWSPPYYWAGFVFQGDYTNRIDVKSNSRLYVGLALLLLVLILSGLVVLHRRKRRSFPAQRT